MAIHLGGRLLDPSSGPPGGRLAVGIHRRSGMVAGSLPLLDLAPGGVYLARPVTRPAGELLPHPFTLTIRQTPNGGLVSVALSLAFQPVGVTHHRDPVVPGLSSRRRIKNDGQRPSRPLCPPNQSYAHAPTGEDNGD